MAKFIWQDGALVSKAKVEVDGVIYEVDPEEYSGTTPLSASNLNAMQDGIYEDMEEIGSRTTLWTNPNPNGDFDNQTITLSDDMNNYRYLIIEFLTYKDRGSIYTAIIENYNKSHEFGTIFNYDWGIFPCARLIEIPANNQLYIETCYGYWNFVVDRSQYNHPDWLVPLRVIGVK